MLTCGDGLDVVREFVLENEFGLIESIYPATNPIGHMGGGPSASQEKCMQCREYLLGRVKSISLLLPCSASLLREDHDLDDTGYCKKMN
jgi:hypothetical protein